MLSISDSQFQELINSALTHMPKEHVNSLKNVAILYEDEPTPEQRQKLLLRNDQTLLGLYEGVPLTARQGTTRVYPDKITLFKIPLVRKAATIEALAEEIRHTLWHEIAHYYGLNHDQIRGLER